MEQDSADDKASPSPISSAASPSRGVGGQWETALLLVGSCGTKSEVCPVADMHVVFPHVSKCLLYISQSTTGS